MYKKGSENKLVTQEFLQLVVIFFWLRQELKVRSNLCLYKSMVLAVLSLPSSQIPTLIGISLCGVFSCGVLS